MRARVRTEERYPGVFLPPRAVWLAAGCIAFSVALHTLLLSIRLPAPSRSSGPANMQQLHARFQTRHVVQSSAPPSVDKAAPEQANAQPASAASVRPFKTPDRSLGTGTLAASVSSSPSELLSFEVGTDLDKKDFPVGIPYPPADPFGEYVPRSLLSSAPTPRAPIILNAPEQQQAPGRRVGVFSLFIDEHGEVRRMMAEEPLLPPVYETIAREAFMNAAFIPGELKGSAVKAHVRIEVVFDNTPLP